jgi:FAD/FMN-containing dehydrogenase
MVDKYPAMIVRCANYADVISSVLFARSMDMAVSVRGGGHNIAGSALCDGGIVIDLSGMKGIMIDPVRRIARAQAGLTLGEFIGATRQYGLATTTGVVADTGLAGLTLGGGMGWLMGKYGLAVDNLLSVEIVTADGQLLTASPTQNAELFWGVRGGGGNFGIVTTFEFQLHPVKEVLAGMLVYPLSALKEVLRRYREFCSSAPDELTMYAVVVNTPDGLPVSAIVLCYCGDMDEGKRVIAPLRASGSPLLDTIGPMDYLDLISMFDPGLPTGRHYYEKASTLKDLNDASIDVLVEYATTRTSPFSQVLIQHIHGYASRVDPEATAAFALRGDQYLTSIVSAWEDPEQKNRHMQWISKFWSALESFALEKVYINALDEGDARLRASYGPTYDRLVALKNRYDPTNFFHFNQNIRPTVHTTHTRPLAQEGRHGHRLL